MSLQFLLLNQLMLMALIGKYRCKNIRTYNIPEEKNVLINEYIVFQINQLIGISNMIFELLV